MQIVINGTDKGKTTMLNAQYFAEQYDFSYIE